MKDMNAPPKKMALMKGCISVCVVPKRRKTVPIRIARPRYMAILMP